MMVARLARIALVLLVAGGATLQAQSLWNPGFSGYLSGHNALSIGDLVSVKIDTKTKLAYSSSQVSDRVLTLEFSGGAAPGILSFLPQGQTGEKSSLKDGEELDLSTLLGARVARLDGNGNAFIEGTRTVDVGGKQESITVSGWLDPAMLSSQGAMSFDELADSKLVFQTGLAGQAPVLTQSDISQVLAQVQGAGAPAGGAAPAPTGAAAAAAPTPAAPGVGAAGGGAAAPPVAAGAPPAPAAAAPGAAGVGPAPGAAGASPTYTLTEQKKRELLLQYLNDMLSLIFSGSGK